MRTTLPLVSLLAFTLSCASAAPEASPPASPPQAAARAAATQAQAAPAGVASAEPAAAARAAEPADDGRPRIGALGPHTWIWKKPARTGLAMGKMRIGTTVALRSPDPVSGPGCKGKWYAIEPRGYVCNDNTATLDLDDPYFRALAFSAPDPGVWPYHYAHSNGSPMYSRVPTPEEWAKAERGFGPTGVWKPLGEWSRGHEENILDEPITPSDPVPYFLEGGKRSVPGGNFDASVLVWKKIPAGSMLSYARAFEMYGRVWLLTPDTMVVPADRMSKMKRSTFHGVYFDETDLTLPFAWNRSKGALPKYRRDGDGKFVPSGETLAPKSPLEIGEAEVKADGWIYYELRREPGLFVGKTLDVNKQLDVDLVVTRAAQKLPKGIEADQRWIEARIVPGTLTAYDGLTPVMTTLFSPGKGGPPIPSYVFPVDHSRNATTALGYFPLEWKERVATMSNEPGDPKTLWFTDVPNQQYLKAPLAMHVAYWHEDYGKRKSAECLNVSPLDGKWLFEWTLPVLPPGWNAAGAGQGNGPSTPVYVTIQ